MNEWKTANLAEETARRLTVETNTAWIALAAKAEPEAREWLLSDAKEHIAWAEVAQLKQMAIEADGKGVI